MICRAYQIANAINTKALPSERKLREVSYIKIQRNIFVVFPYGVVVCWGDGHLAEILMLVRPYLDEPIPSNEMTIDEFEVNTEALPDAKLVFEDCINLNEISDLILVALSHPLAQSLRLIQFEESILRSIEKIKHIPQNLALHGKIYESKKKISQLQGHLYLLKGNISFEHSLLDKPEFFWEYPEYDEFYLRMAEYLEILPRIDILNKKINTIDEILSILSDELNHRHSSKLEVVIILLILLELVIFFLKDIFKLI